MKTFVSLFLFLLMLTQIFSLWMMDGAYRLNKTYVATNLCINKNNPTLHCDGKCYLSKQIAKNANSDAQLPGSKKEKNTIPVCVLPEAVSVGLNHHKNIVYCSYYTAGFLPGFVPSPFQPPRFSFAG